MCRTTLSLYLSSENEGSIREAICVLNVSGMKPLDTSDKLGILVVSLEDNTGDLDHLLAQGIAFVRNVRNHISSHSIESIEYIINIIIENMDADRDSFPAMVFPKEFIKFAAKIELRLNISIYAYSSYHNEQVNSGAYYYIISDKELDVEAISQIAKARPTIMNKRGDRGSYTIIDFYSWGIEITDKERSEGSVLALMNKLKEPAFLGNYCRRLALHSHIDLTCYAIPNGYYSFGLDSSFFDFCRDLDVDYFNIDLMI